MKSVFIRSVLASFFISASIFAPYSDASASNLENLTLDLSLMNRFQEVHFKANSECETCDSENCFSSKLEASLRLGDRFTNLCLVPDFCLNLFIKREMLKSTGKEVREMSDELVLSEFSVLQENARKRVNCETLVPFIMDLTRLSRVQGSSVLRKLGWVAEPQGVSPAKLDMEISGEGVVSLIVLPVDIRKLVCSYLDNTSLGALALADPNILCLMGVTKLEEKNVSFMHGELLCKRVNLIRSSILRDYHWTRKTIRGIFYTPIYNHLGLLIFTEKHFRNYNLPDGSGGPLAILYDKMKAYVGKGEQTSGNLILQAMFGVALKDFEEGSEQKEALILFQQYFAFDAQAGADWSDFSKVIKKEIKSAEREALRLQGVEIQENHSSSEEDGCVLM